MRYKRLNPKVRKKEILAAGVKLAEAGGYATLTRQQVAREAGTSPPLITRYFSTMEGMRAAIMQEAVRLPALRTVAQGLACGCPIAKAAPEKVRADALAVLEA